MVPDWYAWVFGGLMVLAIGAAVGVGARRSTPFASLPFQHVAAAAIVGVLGWEASIILPQQLVSFSSVTAGISDPAGIRNYQLVMAAQVAFVAASVAAMIGILRRYPWGTALGIGVSGTRVGIATLGIANTLSVTGEFGEQGSELAWYVVTAALQGVPAVAAMVLLAWPFWRGEADRAAGSMPDDIEEIDTEIELTLPEAVARPDAMR